jgi:hypothetical protein
MTIMSLSLALLTPLRVFAELDLFQQPVQLENPSTEFLTVTQRLQRISVMRSHFSQRKQIKILTRPLISNGFMLFSAKLGLYWQIESPLSSITIFTKQGLFEKRHGVVSRQKQVQMAHFGNLFSAIFAGNIKTLSEHFDLYFSASAKTYDWKIGLIPKIGMLQKVFNKIILKGSQQLEKIFIDEQRGDTTLLQFSGIKTVPAQLTPEEEKYFDF